MLIQQPNIDAHLDSLENVDGNVFFLSAQRISSNDCESFVTEVCDEIYRSEKDDTVIFCEDTHSGWDKAVKMAIEKIASNLESNHHSVHRVHAFTLPKTLYLMMKAEDEKNVRKNQNVNVKIACISTEKQLSRVMTGSADTTRPSSILSGMFT